MVFVWFEVSFNFENGFAQRSLEVNLLQGSYRSWKTWKVMEFVILISRPGKSWNLSEGHGKSWKSNMLGKKMF